MKATVILITAASLALGSLSAQSQSALLATEQQPAAAQLTESGQIVVAGHSTPYLIRRLPVSSFPELPVEVQDALSRRGCMIPQTYEAHHPENVVHARLERPGSSDWAVLCSAQGTVSLLVFFTSDASQGQEQAQHSVAHPFVLASMPETQRLQAHGTAGVLGFSWGIDTASPEKVHEAQSGLEHRQAYLDHDALADSIVDQKTIYHFYAKSAWTMVELPE
jgi:hypothetical protein